MIAGPAAAARFWKPEVRACETAMMNRARSLLVFFAQETISISVGVHDQKESKLPGKGFGLLPCFSGSGLLADPKVPSKGVTVDSRENHPRP